MINFTIPGIPIAQPRQRHAVIAGQVRNYTPASSPVNAFKASARYAASHNCSNQMVGPLTLHATFVLPRTKSMLFKRKSMPRCWHVVKPDLDNLVKALKDALTGICWHDDRQVCQMIVEKLYAAGDEQPCVEVTIDEAVMDYKVVTRS